MEIYGSFGGGMVTQAHPEKLNDDQSVLLENADIVAGGVVQSRGAYSRTNAPNPTITGNSQGRWLYKKTDGTFTEITAINGKLYTVVGDTFTLVTITGLTQFQTTRPIDAVQNREKMYFATGSGIVEYDGTTFSLMTAYAPNGLEALYIGRNGYAANPDAFLSDTNGAANVILGVTTSTRYGMVNQSVTFTAYVQSVIGDTLEYLFEYKQVIESEASWRALNSSVWSTTKSKSASWSGKGDYMIRVSLRKQGTQTVLSQYVIPKFKVNSTPDDKPEPSIDFDDLKLCNRIFVHYDRLCIYGDTGNPDHLYVSHLNKFNYFPRTNVIRVVDPLRGALQSVVQYKDFLVCFTDGSIQGITGKQPLEYTRFPIHTTLGTKFGYSTQVMKNYITFVGNDNGIYILKSFNYASNDKMNVERIDEPVKDVVVGLLKTATRVLSAIYNDQYYLYIEGSTNYMYRFYYEYGVWVRDRIPFNCISLVNVNNVLRLMDTGNGYLYELKHDVFVDNVATTYTMKVHSKDYSFNQPHHRKKLKQYQLLVKLTSSTTINVSLYADNNLLSTTALTSDPTQNSDAQKLRIMSSGRFRYVKTEISFTVNELVQLTGFCFVFKMNTPK